MTFNSVRIACNQTSSRELVVGEDEELVARTLRALKDKDLVALTWAGSGQSRGEACPDIRAATQARAGRASTGHRVIAARAQPAGALKTRTERLVPRRN